MSEWKPKPDSNAPLTALDLDAEEGFVLSRLDGHTSVTHLTQLTGFPRNKIERILGRLVRVGVVQEAERNESAAPGEDEPTLDDQAPVSAPSPAKRSAQTDGPPPADADTDEGAPAPDGGDDPTAESDVTPEDAASENDASERDGSEDDAAAVDDDPFAFERTRNYRRLYEETLKALDVDERIARVTTATGPELFALCYDPVPKVIARIIAHEKTTRHHARLIAAHHRTSSGLDFLAKKVVFLRDAQLQRALFKNAQLSEALLTKILAPKRIADVYQLAMSREVTARTKRTAQKGFRRKFSQATPDERAQLIFKVEGRCLTLLIGVGIDGRTAALLSQRAIHSTLLIQNLCRWPSCPPAVLAHLAKQGAVKRQANLKNMIVRHPNAPTHLKR